jgi:hypothetical protein
MSDYSLNLHFTNKDVMFMSKDDSYNLLISKKAVENYFSTAFFDEHIY